MNAYATPVYWDTRYAADPGASFDWYCTYAELAPYLAPYLKSDPSFEILVAGCGSSTLSACLYDAGFKNISNVDISSVVVSQLRDRYAAMSEMDFSVADACNMKKELPGDCFDLVIDKALLDAVLCGDDALGRTSSMTSEIYRVLKPGGVYIAISYGPPATRLGFLTPPGIDWQPIVVEIPKPRVDTAPAAASTLCYFMYVMRKPEAADE